MNISQKAEIARTWFEQKSRDYENHFWTRAEGSPEEAGELAYATHDGGEILPDNYRYEFLVEALDVISDSDGGDNGAAAIEADVYTSDLTEWLHSSPRRVFYMDEALQEWGHADDGFQLLALAQIQEKLEVFYAVESWLVNWHGIEEDEDD